MTRSIEAHESRLLSAIHDYAQAIYVREPEPVTSTGGRGPGFVGMPRLGSRDEGALSCVREHISSLTQCAYGNGRAAGKVAVELDLKMAGDEAGLERMHLLNLFRAVRSVVRDRNENPRTLEWALEDAERRMPWLREMK